MDLHYWVENSGSFMHQIFMIVMGALYALAYLFGVSYKAINIYTYFILYPLSFTTFFLKGSKALLFIPFSFLFFLVPDFEGLSVQFFDACVVFLNEMASLYNSDYIRMSIYLCVLVPIILYLPFILYRFGVKGVGYTLVSLATLIGLYYVVVYPSFEPLVNTYF